MTEQVTIHCRFRGPPGSGNGGYTCGTVAGLIGAAAEVTLRRPPPLDRPLDVERRSGGVALRDGEAVVAEGIPASVELEVPEPISFAQAEAASRSYLGVVRHPFPECFVCGPERAEDDGLRLLPGWVPGRRMVAAPWKPGLSLAGGAGAVPPEFVWAALDCPGGWSLFSGAEEGRPVVLGRQAARLLAPVLPGGQYVVIGWPRGEEGRKLYSGTALFSADGRLCAIARATWVRLLD